VGIVVDVVVVVGVVVEVVVVAGVVVEVVVVVTFTTRGATTAVASEVATELPFLLVETTETRKVEPTSAPARRCVALVSPATAAQAPPPASHRDHWSA
jgi:hypothetical protein